MFRLEIKDGKSSAIFEDLETSLTMEIVEGATDTTTLNLGYYTDFFASKRQVQHKWSRMTKTEFETLKGFYERQFELFESPKITIERLGVVDMKARMTLSSWKIDNDCGDVVDITASWREV